MSNLKEQFNKFIDSLPERVNETPKKVVWEFIEKAIKKEKEAMAKAIIKLSDEMESKHPTKFDEWRAFKGFRNRLRDYCKDNKLNIE